MFVPAPITDTVRERTPLPPHEIGRIPANFYKNAVFLQAASIVVCPF